MEFSELLDIVQSQKEQLSPSLQKCVTALDSVKELKSKRTSFTYNVLTTIAIERLSKGITVAEYTAGISCIAHLIGIWKEFVKVVKKNQFGNILYKFITHCNFEVNKKTLTVIKLYLKYVTQDKSYDPNVMKWIIKKLSTIVLPKDECICATDNTSCKVLTYSKLKNYGFILRSCLFDNDPLSIIHYLNSHVHEISGSKPPCCHFSNFFSAIEKQLKSLECLVKSETYKNYIQDSFQAIKSVLQLQERCKKCRKTNELNLLNGLRKHLGKLLWYVNELEEDDLATFCTHGLNHFLLFLNVCVRTNAALVNCEHKIVVINSIFQNFLQFFPAFNESIEKCTTVSDAYLPRCLNNVLSVIINTFTNFGSNENVCDSIALLCEDLISVATNSSYKCDDVLLDNIKKTIKVLCHVSYSKNISDVFDNAVSFILNQNEQYDILKLVEIRTFWLTKYCKSNTSLATFLYSNLNKKLPMRCLVKILQSEIYFYSKYKLIQPQSIQVYNFVPQKWDQDNIQALLELSTLLYALPTYFKTKTTPKKICSTLLENMQKDEIWELVIWAKYLIFLSHWQEAVIRDSTMHYNEPDCKDESITSIAVLLESVTLANSQLQNGQQLKYTWQTCNLIVSIGNLLRLHGHLLSCQKLFATLCEFLQNQNPDLDESTLFALMVTAIECGNVNFELNFPDSVTKYYDIASANCTKYEKKFPNSKRKHAKFVGISIKLLNCKNMYLKTKMESAFKCLDALDKECQSLEQSCIREWFLSQINFVRSKVYPYLYENENIDYKIMPLKASLSSLFSINASNNGYFKEILNKTFSKSSVPIFDEANTPIIPFENNECIDIILSIQVSAIIEILNICYAVSRFYFTNGDLDTVYKYLPIGMHLAKRFKLYGQAAKFSLLALQLSSEGDTDVDNDVKAVQEELELLNLSKINEENQKYDRKYSNALQREVKSTAVPESQPLTIDDVQDPNSSGNDEEDKEFIIVSSVIEGLDDIKQSETKSSPTFKRKKFAPKLPKIEVILHAKSCKCDSCSDIQLICWGFEIGFCIVKSLLGKGEEENALHLCSKILEKCYHFKRIFCDDISARILDVLTAQGLLYKCVSSKGNDDLCMQTIKEMNDTALISKLPLIDNLQSKMNLLSCKMVVQPFKNSFKKSAIDLDDIINSNAGVVPILNPNPIQLLPPCTPAPRKMPKDITNSIKQTRSVKKTNKPSTKTKGGAVKGFDIFNDDAPEIKIKVPLPKPNLISEEELISGVKELCLTTPATVKRKPRRRIVVADSSSDEDSFITLPTPVVKKSPPNIRKTRRAAAVRNRRKNGPVYTDKSPESTRGVKKAHAVGKTSSRYKLNIPEEPKSSKVKILDMNHSDSLMKVLNKSIRLDDVLTVKECLQLLSDHHFQLYCENAAKESLYSAICFHLISVGVSYRGQSHYYMQQASKTVNLAPEYKTWLQDAVKATHPRNLLSTIEKPISYVKNCTKHIPPDWTICTISFIQMCNKNHLILTRTTRDSVPIHVQLTDTSTAEILDQFADILANNAFSIKNVKDKSTWWTNRRDYNRDIKILLQRIENESLSFIKAMLRGKPVHNQRCEKLENEAKIVAELLQITTPFKMEFIKLFLDTWSKMNANDKGQAIEFLCGDEVSKTNRAKACAYIADKFKNDGKVIKRHHVVLVLDKQIQGFPWENIPLLYKDPITRMPSYETLILQLQLMNCLNSSVAAKGVDMNTVSYILNPAKDLMATEKRFKEWFESAESWKGIVSRPPTTEEWIECITNYDLFIYTGHGSGSKYVHSNTISKLQGRAASFIMGCSSGALKEYGSYEPSGPVLAYLIAGIPCVLSCLWTVTDKDIDRFLAKIIATWACNLGQEENLAECMHVASSSCNMRWLNGAACVIYGLPVNCQVKMQKLLDSLPEIFIAK